jgi:hypothetical protein
MPHALLLSPELQDLLGVTADHRETLTAVERHLSDPLPLPHHHPTSTVSFHRHLLALQVHHALQVLALQTFSAPRPPASR